MAAEPSVPGDAPSRERNTRLARLILVTFLFTFITARTLVFLIMTRVISDLYVHVRGTHVHHLNVGIFLLSFVGAWLLLRRPSEREMPVAAAVYGVGLALTFDEFGMWLHLGGSYWQRASFDAVTVVAALLALVAFAPSIKRFRPRHWVTAILLACALVVFAYGLLRSFRYADERIAPAIHRMEQAAPD